MQMRVESGHGWLARLARLPCLGLGSGHWPGLSQERLPLVAGATVGQSVMARSQLWLSWEGASYCYSYSYSYCYSYIYMDGWGRAGEGELGEGSLGEERQEDRDSYRDRDRDRPYIFLNSPHTLNITVKPSKKKKYRKKLLPSNEQSKICVTN